MSARFGLFAGAGQSSRWVRGQLIERARQAASIFALSLSCLADAASTAWMQQLFQEGCNDTDSRGQKASSVSGWEMEDPAFTVFLGSRQLCPQERLLYAFHLSIFSRYEMESMWQKLPLLRLSLCNWLPLGGRFIVQNEGAGFSEVCGAVLCTKITRIRIFLAPLSVSCHTHMSVYPSHSCDTSKRQTQRSELSRWEVARARVEWVEGRPRTEQENCG